MPDPQRIDPVLVEKAAKAVWDDEWTREKALGPNPWEEQEEELRVEIRAGAEAVIRVVFDELGLQVGEAREMVDAAYVRTALAMLVGSEFSGPNYYAICRKLEDALAACESVGRPVEQETDLNA